MPISPNVKSRGAATREAGPEIFKHVYDSPLSLPGKHRWVTKDGDVRTSEKLLGIPERKIGAPLCVSGDTRDCPNYRRETNWLDIAWSALAKTYQKKLLVEVILGERKYVNVGVPRAIADVSCYKCKAPITDLRSFKCDNWAYAREDM